MIMDNLQPCLLLFIGTCSSRGEAKLAVGRFSLSFRRSSGFAGSSHAECHGPWTVLECGYASLKGIH